MILRRTVAGMERSLIPVGEEKTSAAAIRLFRGIGTLGHVHRDGRVLPWKAEGFTTVEGKSCLYGPLVDAQPLFDADHPPGEAESLFLLADAGEACAAFLREGVLTAAFRLDLLYRLRGGGFLLLSDPVASRLPARKESSGRPTEKTSPNPPGVTPGPVPASPAAAVSLALGLAAHRIMSFPAESAAFPPPPLEALRPDIRQDAAAFVERALRASLAPSYAARASLARASSARASSARASPAPEPEEWPERLRDWARNGYTRELPAEELRRRKKRGRRMLRALDRKARTLNFIRRRSGFLAALGGAAAVFLVLGLPILQGILAPPVTAGKTPEEVVRLFYTSLGRLDIGAMRDCVTQNAGDHYIDAAAHLYTISRVRQAVERVEGVLDAQEWERRGRPPETAVFGAAGLSVAREPGGRDGEELFTVRFELLRPLPGSVPGSLGLPVAERVHTRFIHRAHRIFRIEPLPPDPDDGDRREIP